MKNLITAIAFLAAATFTFSAVQAECNCGGGASHGAAYGGGFEGVYGAGDPANNASGYLPYATGYTGGAIVSGYRPYNTGYMNGAITYGQYNVGYPYDHSIYGAGPVHIDSAYHAYPRARYYPQAATMGW